MNGQRKSDSAVVPPKSPNKAARAVAEGMEGRALAKGNLQEQNVLRTQRRASVRSALERVRQAAKQDKAMRFTALLHHVYNLDTLREAYFSLKKDAAPGVDGQTWHQYGEALEEHLRDLAARLKRGAYRAKPVRRVFIAKDGGGQRPLGVTVLDARGKVIVVRYADDIVVGFQVKTDAERFRTELAARMQQFALQLHPEKTRLLEFGPYAAARRKRAGLGSPRHSTSLALRTSVPPSEAMGASRCCGRRCAGGCRQSSGRSKPNCGAACDHPQYRSRCFLRYLVGLRLSPVAMGADSRRRIERAIQEELVTFQGTIRARFDGSFQHALYTGLWMHQARRLAEVADRVRCVPCGGRLCSVLPDGTRFRPLIRIRLCETPVTCTDYVLRCRPLEDRDRACRRVAEILMSAGICVASESVAIFESNDRFNT
ncbi:MAG TPA: hypothetical protein VFR86_16415 [Burkholderiaceae bacterium]|nr:hypothetical protein [Burkholderiaceae bacterium]